ESPAELQRGTAGTAGPARFRTGRRTACPKDSRTDRRRTSRGHLTSFNSGAPARSTRFWSARGESRRGMGGRQPGCPCRLVATPGREDASVAEVAAIIRQDPVIAARVLRSANSAAYIGRSPVSSIRDALLRLGLARIRRQALVASLYDAVPVRGTRAAREIFWQHSLGVAHGSGLIA